ncbi:MAG: cytochrome-c peroxidase [Flavobacteriales bacterium]|nr:cytochrome-c peroxidase [Flavobacteriales bacterium]
MSWRTSSHFLALAAGLVFTASCRKDPSILLDEPEGFRAPTPFVLDYPVWANDTLYPINLPADAPLTVEGVALGRKLFYEKALSDNYSISCASCHQQQHAFSDPRRFSIGTDGSVGRRNSMPIQNLAWDHGFFWDTRASSLEEQAFGPVRDHGEMRNSWPVVVERLQAHADYPLLFKKAFGTDVIDSNLVVKAIAQFERTLLSYNSPYDRFVHLGDHSALSEQQQRGMALFFGEAHCNDCHTGPRFNDHNVQNIGLGDLNGDDGLFEVTGNEADRGRFKNIGIRNVSVSAPYMHDGRFATLEEVLDFYARDVDLSTPNLDPHMFAWTLGSVDLDHQERADIVAFLHALTDEDFLTNPAFSDPN